MAGDRSGVWSESAPAGVRSLPDKSLPDKRSKRVDSRKGYKPNNRDNAPSIPSRVGTSWEAAGRPAPPDRGQVVRVTLSCSTALLQSKPVPEQAVAPEPPDSSLWQILDRFSLWWNREPPPALCVRRASLSATIVPPTLAVSVDLSNAGRFQAPNQARAQFSGAAYAAFPTSTVSRKRWARSNPVCHQVPPFPACAAPPQPPLPPAL
jgi:hypothetical protein